LEQAGEIIDDHKPEYLQLIKDQLQAGKAKDDNTVNPVYKADNYANRRYAIKKFAENAKPGYGNPDLYLKGTLYDNMKLDRDKYVLNITSGVSFFQFIDRRYGSTPFGLSPESIQTYREQVLFPLLQRRVNLILTGF
jgi:hypothetical protein